MPRGVRIFRPLIANPRQQTRQAGRTQAEIGSYASTAKPGDLLPKHPASRPHTEHRYDRIYDWHGWISKVSLAVRPAPTSPLTFSKVIGVKSGAGCFHCTDFVELTWCVRRGRFRPKEGHAMSTDITKRPPAPVRSEPQDLDQLIRLRAYQLYEARGREDGHELDDWLRAEEEFTWKKVRTVAA